MTESNEPQGPSSTLRIDAKNIEESQPQRRSWREILSRCAVAVVLFGALLVQFASSFGSTESQGTSETAAAAVASPGRAAPAPTTASSPTSCWSTHDIVSSLDPHPCTCTRS